MTYRPSVILSVAAAAVVACAAPGALADEPERPPPIDTGGAPPASARTTHLLAGAATTAVWYGGAVGFSYLWPDAPGARDLRIPVAGPWMALADTGCPDDDPNCSTFSVVLRAILTAIDGVGQAGGLAIMAEALFLPTAASTRPKTQTASGPMIRPVPITTDKNGLGLGVVGRF